LETNKYNQLTSTQVAQLEVEITEGSTDFQIDSARLTVNNLKPDRSQTHIGNIFSISSPEPSPLTKQT